MNHTISVVETKQLNDGQFAIAVTCCGDPQTKSWLTLASSVASDPDKSQASLDYHNAKVANLHQLSIQSTAILQNLVGKTYIIEPSAPVTSPDPTVPAPTAPSDPNVPPAILNPTPAPTASASA